MTIYFDQTPLRCCEDWDKPIKMPMFMTCDKPGCVVYFQRWEKMTEEEIIAQAASWYEICSKGCGPSCSHWPDNLIPVGLEVKWLAAEGLHLCPVHAKEMMGNANE